MRGRVVLAVVAGVLAITAATLVLAWPVGTKPASAPARPAAALVQPAVAGGPSDRNFCALLRADTGYLAALAQAGTTAQIVAILRRYDDAAPAIATEAPAAIAGPARLYVEETTAVFGAVADANLRRGAVTAALLAPFDTPAGTAASGQVRDYAEAHCGFDIDGA